MPTGALRIIVTDLAGDPVEGTVTVDVQRRSGGSAGATWRATFSLSGGDAVAEMEDIPCTAGPGTVKRVVVTTPNFRRFAFLQRIRPDRTVNGAANPLGLVASPARVTGIVAPAYADLPRDQRDFLEAAEMRAPERNDRHLVGKAGRELYEALGPLRQACLLNIFAKSRHATADGCFQHLVAPLVIRQDRCFCRVSPFTDDFLNDSPRYDNVNGSLHDPLEGYRMLGVSCKTKDSHANLQVTVMEHEASHELAADIDIDEGRGIRHGYEVVRNTLPRGEDEPVPGARTPTAPRSDRQEPRSGLPVPVQVGRRLGEPAPDGEGPTAGRPAGDRAVSS